METNGLWLVGELRGDAPSHQTLELTSGLREFADELSETITIVMPEGTDWTPLARAGADVIVEVHGAGDLGAEALVAGTCEAIGASRPRLICTADTFLGRDVASQLAAALDAALLVACERLSFDGDEITAIRSCFGGQLASSVRIAGRSVVASVREHTFRSRARESDATPELRVVEPELDARIEFLGREAPDPATLDLSESSVVISGGLGVGGPDGFELLEQLAARLGGTTAASRAAVDQGWVDRAKQVGQTGRNVAPRLYFACGISGAREHMVGVRDADLLVALNLDGDAPIMREADLAAIGDAGEVLPRLVAALESNGGQ